MAKMQARISRKSTDGEVCGEGREENKRKCQRELSPDEDLEGNVEEVPSPEIHWAIRAVHWSIVGLCMPPTPAMNSRDYWDESFVLCFYLEQ